MAWGDSEALGSVANEMLRANKKWNGLQTCNSR